MPQPPAVFVHGYSCSSSHWLAAEERLQGHGEVRRLSLPGHDNVPAPDGAALDLDLCAEYVAQQVESTGLAGCRLIGHSLGGMVGMRCGARHPGLLSGLVLVDAFPRLGAPEPFGRSYWHGSDPKLKARVVRQMMNNRRRLPSTLWESVVGFDGTGDLAGLRLPVRGIYGDRGEDDHEGLRNSLLGFGLGAVSDLEIHILRDAGHFVMLEQPSAFYRLLGRVLDALPRG
ncbi:MAG: alpha/beta hydrolase [Armatimonadetes bacterium]|nr:alpha/beta hydrolase [Armatimonadota bacterium]